MNLTSKRVESEPLGKGTGRVVAACGGSWRRGGIGVDQGGERRQQETHMRVDSDFGPFPEDNACLRESRKWL